jgi:hypothetical protein
MAASSYSNPDKEQIIQQYKNWYNHTFFHLEQKDTIPSDRFSDLIRTADIGITLNSDRGTVVLPIVQLTFDCTLETIFRRALDLLAKADGIEYLTPSTEIPAQDPAITQQSLPKGYDLDHIEYRKKIYIIQCYLEADQYQFIVERQEDGRIIDPSKKTYEHVVNGYKQKYPERFNPA